MNPDIQAIRKQITEIDQEIIALISKRLSLATSLAKLKQQLNIPIYQPERENQLQKQYWRIALTHKINPKLIQDLFQLIIQEMTKLQREVLEHD